MSDSVRIIYYSTWADGVTSAEAYLSQLPGRDLSSRVADPANEELLRLARLDCDWDAECLRCFSVMKHPSLQFLEAKIAGPLGLVEIVKNDLPRDEQTWLIFIGQRPASIDSGIVPLLEIFTKRGGKVLYWSFDEASRRMKCFHQIAKYFTILIHDEDPLESTATPLLQNCECIHHSWVANIAPFFIPFVEEVQSKIVFLGSRLGMTENRFNQINALQNHFKDRFLSIFDHSIPVAERSQFAKIKVHLCPEGRMFTTSAMSRSHTDRPFWAGCMGQIPVIENSEKGDRLEELVQKGIVLRYSHGNTEELLRACEKALEMTTSDRENIYQYFNKFETVGNIAAQLIAKSST